MADALMSDSVPPRRQQQGSSAATDEEDAVPNKAAVVMDTRPDDAGKAGTLGPLDPPPPPTTSATISTPSTPVPPTAAHTDDPQPALNSPSTAASSSSASSTASAPSSDAKRAKRTPDTATASSTSSTRRRSRRLLMQGSSPSPQEPHAASSPSSTSGTTGTSGQGTSSSGNATPSSPQQDSQDQAMSSQEQQQQQQQTPSLLQPVAPAPPTPLLRDLADPVDRMASKHIPSHARVGLLVWVKQKGSPFWPSMLTYEPHTGNLIKRNPNGDIRMLHVQFFGDVITRAWSSYKSAMRLWDYQQENGGWELIKERVKPSLQKAFKISMEQARKAASMSLRERILEWTCFGEYDAPPAPAVEEQQRQDEEEQSKKQKKKKSKKDRAKEVDASAPPKPKRYTSAFFYFLKEQRNNDPAPLSVTESSRVFGQKWKELSDEAKAPYLELERRDRQRYARDMEKYKELLVAHAREHGATTPSMSKLISNKPKRGRSAYIFFRKEKEEELKKICATPQELLSKLGEMWQALSEDQKQVYKDRSEKDKLRYRRELLVFETNAVVELGRQKVEQLQSPEAADEMLQHIRLTPDLTLSGPVLFTLETSKRISADSDVADTAKHVLDQWNALTQEEQQQWHAKAATTRRKAAKRAAERESQEDADAAAADGDASTTDAGEDSSVDVTKHDDYCGICGEAGNLLCCEGGCLSSYHLFCVGLSCAPQGAFVCDACTTGNHLCFACEQPGGLEGLQTCSVRNCGKKYHRACISNNPRAALKDNSFKCPLHKCANCTYPQASTYPLVRCIRCPIAYHTCCVPAGCLHENAIYLLCPKHQPVEKHAKSNICLACGDGGRLFCCDTCPAAYHQECLKDVLALTGTPSEDSPWYCHECLGGVKATEQDIVWYKLGQHRFWPARILEHTQIPEALRSKRPPGICFALNFFGTNEVSWGRHDACIRWMRGDEKSRFSTSRGKPAFLHALQEAALAYDAVQADKSAMLEAIRGRMASKPPAFQRVRTNVYTIPRKRTPGQECCCSPATDTCDDSCLNRIVHCECDPKTCPVKDKCQNRRFQRRQYPKLIPFLTQSKGWGLKAGEDIAEGQFVIEYVGEIIDATECRRRLAASQAANDHSFYILSLSGSSFVDARNKANLARFINHSCGPNCETQKWNVLGETRVGIFAKEDIPKGTELTFDYQLDSLGSRGRTTCHCGASSCRGVIEKLGREAAQSRATPLVGADGHEDICHKCRKPGTLLLCDFEGCPRVYHPECAGVNMDDEEDDDDEPWFCPAHVTPTK
ncbi:hypothetical protein PTSG_09362 [Salpingoeca rosetta]|uniref:Uncharacterized protein n=1 Tax=Salpingoeca rosetta (strain ATCC 50818 / BSB-021) TaxID=946362 RepID=F2UME7_SALR5|nr:uncharacterized protein PTSG_09362 [Salpingoeca rosetta]EGD78296.1 hypothetical protein PTSG_09362 [Salpingoeca rosetta]|eukprot:XP_004989619.1 hypothetical protein PTSG_09362 [Salpingoeca rosetta]